MFAIFLIEGGPERYLLGIWSSIDLIKFDELRYGYDHNERARLISNIEERHASSDTCYGISVINIPTDTLFTLNIHDGYDQGSIFYGSINDFKKFLINDETKTDDSI